MSHLASYASAAVDLCALLNVSVLKHPLSRSTQPAEPHPQAQQCATPTDCEAVFICYCMYLSVTAVLTAHCAVDLRCISDYGYTVDKGDIQKTVYCNLYQYTERPPVNQPVS